MRRLGPLLRVAAVLLAVTPLAAQTGPAQQAIPVELAVATARFPHDPQAFTEGLFIDGGQMFESTGEVGRSSVRQVDLKTGKVLRSVTIPASQFGEGIAPWNGQILSLTWQDGVGYRWSRKGFKRLGSFKYAGEGWSLTSSGTELVMSDGTDTLRFVDPRTFTVKRTLKVTVQGRALNRINELEWVGGQILANVWMTDYVVRIDPLRLMPKICICMSVSEVRRRPGTPRVSIAMRTDAVPAAPFTSISIGTIAAKGNGASTVFAMPPACCATVAEAMT